jgi:hypothetical protein
MNDAKPLDIIQPSTDGKNYTQAISEVTGAAPHYTLEDYIQYAESSQISK